MPTYQDVERIVSTFAGVEERTRHGHRTWAVHGKSIAWERPFSKADVKRFGAQTPPAGPILAVTVEDLGEKEAVLAAGTDGFFTIEHFSNYPAFLIALDRVSEGDLRDALVDAWLACAPARLRDDFTP